METYNQKRAFGTNAKWNTGTRNTAIIAPPKTDRKALFKMTRFIDLNACKNSISSSLPIPGITALDHAKKMPATIPVSRMAAARMVGWILKTKFYRCKFTLGMIQPDILAQRKPTRRSSMPSP